MKAQQEIKEYEDLCQKKKDMEAELQANETSQDILYKYLLNMKEVYDKAKSGAEDQEHIKLQLQQLNSTIKETEKNATLFVEEMKDFVNTMELNVFLPKLAASMSHEIESIQRKKEELKRSLESLYSYDEVESIAQKVIDYLQQFSLCTSDIDAGNVAQYIMATQKNAAQEDEYAFLDEGDVSSLLWLKRLNAVNGFIQLDAKRKSLDAQIKELPNQRI